jgi:two-component system phosphate regulon response regulator PhoB
MTRNTVLIVEDEDEIRDMLSFSLARAGYSVVSAADAEEALQSLDGPLPDLIIIDWMLPGMSGIDLARIMRNDAVTSDLPMIMLTAKGEEVDKLKSFEAGVDDYVTKPFSPRELIARVKAILRRSGAPEEGVLVVERLKLDTRARRLSVDGDEVRIGPTEFRLLEFLMRHPERVFDRGQLLDRVWGRTVYIEERTVDVHVLRLRKILAPFGLDNFIQTVRGVGYRFSTTV